jgi:hypothetical protein
MSLEQNCIYMPIQPHHVVALWNVLHHAVWDCKHVHSANVIVLVC